MPFPGLFCSGGDIPGGASLPGIFYARLHRISSISDGSQKGSLQNQVCIPAKMRCGSRARAASQPGGRGKMTREKPGSEADRSPKKEPQPFGWSSLSGARTPRRAGGITAATSSARRIIAQVFENVKLQSRAPALVAAMRDHQAYARGAAPFLLNPFLQGPCLLLWRTKNLLQLSYLLRSFRDAPFCLAARPLPPARSRPHRAGGQP